MTEKLREKKDRADHARRKYMRGEITYHEAKEVVQVYIDSANVIVRKIAKQHKMKPKLISAAAYMR